jgi:hypothetical protein
MYQILKIISPNNLFIITAGILLFASCNSDEKELPPPVIHVVMPQSGFEIEIGDSLRITPKITYDYNSTYRWYKEGTFISDESSILHESTDLGTINYSFVVEAPHGKDSLLIPVSTIIHIDFKEIELTVDSHSIAAEAGAITSKGTVFPSFGSSDETWAGFALSNKYSQANEATPDIFSAYAPKSTRNNFLIYGQPENPKLAAFYFEDENEHRVGSLSVTNSTLAFLVMRFGTADGISRFGVTSNNEPDWFLLTIEGFTAQGIKSGEVKTYLADFRFPNNRDNFILSTWRSIDLRELGMINRVVLTLTSSLNDDQGQILTPPFVCIDNIKIVE